MLRRALKWLAIAMTAALCLTLAIQSYFLVKIWWWRDHPPATTAFMERRLAALREKNPAAALQYTWVPYDRLSIHLKRAVLTAEDDKFVDHEGFDWEGIQRALEKNQRKGKVVAGGSTISQQLAKNLFLSGERSWWRKGQEAIITVMLETMLDKRRILEIYLNVIEWGDSVFGAEAAARHYYGVGAAQLSAPQSAKLAAMVPRPRFYDRHRESPYLLKRTEILLSRMPNAQLP